MSHGGSEQPNATIKQKESTCQKGKCDRTEETQVCFSVRLVPEDETRLVSVFGLFCLNRLGDESQSNEWIQRFTAGRWTVNTHTQFD